jgi:hypothetical protein
MEEFQSPRLFFIERGKLISLYMKFWGHKETMQESSIDRVKLWIFGYTDIKLKEYED